MGSRAAGVSAGGGRLTRLGREQSAPAQPGWHRQNRPTQLPRPEQSWPLRHTVPNLGLPSAQPGLTFSHALP